MIHPIEPCREVDFLWTIATAPTGRAPAPCRLIEAEAVIGAQVGGDRVLWSRRS